jgi:hypothetical protein
MNKHCKIQIVDKKNEFYQLFKGFRKHKFEINSMTSILTCTELMLQETTIFFVVLYEPKDIIQLVKLAPISKSIIIGTVNKRLFNSLRSIQDYPLVNLSPGVHLMSNLQDALARFY